MAKREIGAISETIELFGKFTDTSIILKYCKGEYGISPKKIKEELSKQEGKYG